MDFCCHCWKAAASSSSPLWPTPPSITLSATVLLGWSLLSVGMGMAGQEAARCLYQSCTGNQENVTRPLNLGQPRNLGGAGGNMKQKVYTELGKRELFLGNLILTAAGPLLKLKANIIHQRRKAKTRDKASVLVLRTFPITTTTSPLFLLFPKQRVSCQGLSSALPRSFALLFCQGDFL